jgi:hypothetical protein
MAKKQTLWAVLALILLTFGGLISAYQLLFRPVDDGVPAGIYSRMAYPVLHPTCNNCRDRDLLGHFFYVVCQRRIKIKMTHYQAHDECGTRRGCIDIYLR